MTEVEKKLREILDGLYYDSSTVPHASQDQIDYLLHMVERYWGAGNQPATMWPIDIIVFLALEACQARRERQAAGGEPCPTEKVSATSNGPR